MVSSIASRCGIVSISTIAVVMLLGVVMYLPHDDTPSTPTTTTTSNALSETQFAQTNINDNEFTTKRQRRNRIRLDQLSTTIEQQTTIETKVVSMFSRKLWMRYAAAAVVFGMIAFGINFMLQQPKAMGPIVEIPTIKTEEQFNKELASISEEEIISYLKLTADSKDAETMAALVDQTHLPNEAEYMDDAFLESFMKELEQTEQQTN